MPLPNTGAGALGSATRLRTPGRTATLNSSCTASVAVDRIELRPSLFRDLHRPFALGAGERFAARCLLALLRLPGGAKLLRAWHARRGA